jgi:hypothetical protein
MSNSENLNIAAMSDLAEASSTEEVKESKKAFRDRAKLVLLSVSNKGKWHILQEFLIEIHADGKIKEGLGQRFPTLDDQLVLLHKKISFEFEDDPTTRDILLNYATERSTLNKWSKLPGWNDAVIDKMKSYGLFTPENRAAVINSMKEKAVKDGDVQAAKVWLTMSGDYTDKIDVNDQKFEKYKEYANSLTSGVKLTDDK